MISTQGQPPRDPLEIAGILWPHVQFFDKQAEIIYSVRDNFETIVPAGNKLGKDFVSAFIAVGAFLAPNIFLRNPEDGWLNSTEVKIITTSIAARHLDVLWGEMGKFIQQSAFALDIEEGGPLIVNQHHLRKLDDATGQIDRISHVTGMVCEKPEKITGHHADHTLLIIDEASGVDDAIHEYAATWAKRILIIGNPNPCTNFFFRGVKAGNVLAPER